MSVCFGRKCTELIGREAGDIRKRAPTLEEEEMSLQGPGWFPRWAPTSELELYQAEAAILNPIRPMISQRTVAGLNTICSLHEKVRGPEKAVVEMHRTITHGQTEVLSQLDADNYASIVFVHGYAGGVANWLPVWKTFAADHDVYAFDLPGFARSVRPSGKPFKNAQDAINWYIGHFEHWFEAMRIGMSAADGTTRPAGRRIVLVGHSFGGYLCSQFTMRHPEIVDHLILVDAWGVHRHVPPTPEEVAKKKAEQSYTQQALTWAMDGIYWSKLLRGMGPAAPAIFAKARPEFMDTWSPFLDDPQQFYDYTYHCNAQTPHTGERAFGCIRCPLSGPFAAQKPLFLSRHRFPRTRRESDDSPAPEGTTFHSFTSNCGCPHSPVTHQPREIDDTATTISSGSSETSVNPSRPLLGVSDASTLTADERLMLIGRSPTPTPSEFGRDDSPNNVCSPNTANVGPSPNSVVTEGDSADIGSPPPASVVTSPNQDTTQNEAPFPHHGTPREGFKLTLLYGSDSWLRSDDVGALCPLLRKEYGTDAHFAMIEKAGHMVMVDNALQFSTEMQKRL